MTSRFADLTRLFDFKFNYINQYHLPGIDLFLGNADVENTPIDSIICERPIALDQLNVFDFSENFVNPKSLLKLSQILSCGHINHIFLSSDPAVETDTIFYFPVFYLEGMQNWPDQKDQVFEHKKNYNISCLNKASHGHRIQNIVPLIEKKYDSVLYSWVDQPGDGASATPGVMEKYQKLRDQKLIPIPDPNPINVTTVRNLYHDAYQASYVHVITESLVRDSVFISEKTWKSVASGQIFFMVGGLGTVSYLRDIGVDVFDDVIDHSYDLDLDWVNRINRMHDSLGQLMQQDLPTIYEQTKDRRQRNQELFFSGKFGMQYVDRINLKFSKGNQV